MVVGGVASREDAAQAAVATVAATSSSFVSPRRCPECDISATANEARRDYDPSGCLTGKQDESVWASVDTGHAGRPRAGGRCGVRPEWSGEESQRSQQMD